VGGTAVPRGLHAQSQTDGVGGSENPEKGVRQGGRSHLALCHLHQPCHRRPPQQVLRPGGARDLLFPVPYSHHHTGVCVLSC